MASKPIQFRPLGPGGRAGRAPIAAVHPAADARGVAPAHWLTQAGKVTARQRYDRIAAPTGLIPCRRPG